MKQSSGTSSSNASTNNQQQPAKLLIDALEQLDLSALANVSSPIASTSPTAATLTAASYDRLNEIARTIITLNVVKDFPNKSDRDEYEATLTKLLQICQTIIDYLLVNGPTSTASKNDLNSYNNNLRQENVKLRKLLTLQQKAIAFRRANLWSASNVADDEDDLTSAGPTENLPEDSTTATPSGNKQTSAKLTTTTFQCIYCPKFFSDSTSFAKHLSLRHLSSSIDDGLPPSLSSSGSTFMARLQRQYQQKSVVTPSELSSQHQSIIDRLQEEITSLKVKLSQTETALDEEKTARHSFESHLKNGIALNVQQIEEQLREKMEEVKFIRNEALIAADQATNANRTVNELVRQLNTLPNVAESTVENRKIQEESKSKDNNQKYAINDKLKEMQALIEKQIEARKQKGATTIQIEKEVEIQDKDEEIENKEEEEEDAKENGNLEETLMENFDDQAKDVSTDFPLKEKPVIEPSELKAISAVPNASQLKQSLRLELISQLTSKRSEKHKQTFQENVEEQVKKSKKHKSSKKVTIAVSEERQPQSESPPPAIIEVKEKAKAEIHSSIESRLREYLSNDGPGQKAVEWTNGHGETTEETPRHDGLDEAKFSNAMQQAQRDRDLLIHQSRYDYDFVEIESTLRNLVDSKVKSKLEERLQNVRESEDNAGDTIDNAASKEMGVTVEELKRNDEEEKTAIVEFTNEMDDQVENFVDDQEMASGSNTQIPEPSAPSPPSEVETPPLPSLKSILKKRHTGPRPRSRRKSFDIENATATESSSPATRRIYFSDQIIEYPISPRPSFSEDSDDVDDEELGLTVSPFATNGSSSQEQHNTRRNQMFVIRSMDKGDDEDDDNRRGPALVQSTDTTDSYSGEKIFINEYSTSSSSSSEDEEGGRPTTANRRQSARGSQVVDVEVHQQATVTPQPAQRKSKTASTLNSLLDDMSPGQSNSQQQTSSSSSSSPTKVQELAELIERKLQQKQSTESGFGDRGGGRPPIGAIDTLASLRQPKASTSSAAADDYDIYDF